MAKGKMPGFMMAKFEKSAADKKDDAKAMMKASKGKKAPAAKGMAYRKGGMVKGKC